MRFCSILFVPAVFLILLLPSPCQAGYPRVLLQTNLGDITIELYNDKAPITVENFLQYVRTGFYDELIFHRVVNGFVIQGGGYYVIGHTIYTMKTNPPIKNESYNNLSNLRGTIAMARTSDPNSAASEFYINLVDNTFLDRKNAADKVGYCVFGNVVAGMNVVDKIADANVIDISFVIPGFTDFPDPPIIINSAKLITPGCWFSADINNDGIADIKDYVYLAANWGKSGSSLWGDLTQNNIVDMRDLLTFGQSWLQKTSWYTFDEDLNNDKIVNLKDFAKLGQNWRIAGKKLLGDFDKNEIVNYLDLKRLSDRWLGKIQ